MFFSPFACTSASFRQTVLAEETVFTQPPLLLFMESTDCTFTVYYLKGGSRHNSCKTRPVRKGSLFNLTRQNARKIPIDYFQLKQKWVTLFNDVDAKWPRHLHSFGEGVSSWNHDLPFVPRTAVLFRRATAPWALVRFCSLCSWMNISSWRTDHFIKLPWPRPWSLSSQVNSKRKWVLFSLLSIIVPENWHILALLTFFS